MRFKSLLCILSASSVFAFSSTALADTFDLNASISQDKIVDGTKSFDKDDSAGHDSSEHNGIVRSFDTISYPLKLVVNGSSADNIEVKISGVIHNSFLNGSQQAKFSTGKIGVSNGEATTEDTYTIEHTGSAVSIPEVVEVLGAKNGLKLSTHFRIQIMKVNGKDVSSQNIVKEIDTKDITVSSRPCVDIRADQRHTSSLIPIGDLYPNEDERNKNDHNLYGKMGITLFAKPLPEHGSSLKGSAYPTGEVKFDIHSNVFDSFDNGLIVPANVHAKFLGYGDIGDYEDDHFKWLPDKTLTNDNILSHLQHQIMGTLNVVDGPPISSDKYYHNPRFENAGVYNYVKNSGDWNFDINNDVASVSNTDYVIGDKKATIAAYLDDPRSDSQLKSYTRYPGKTPFSSQQIGFMIPYNFGRKGKDNPENKSNDLYCDFTIDNLRSIEDGKEVNYSATYKDTAHYRYTPDGNFIMSGAWTFAKGGRLDAGSVVEGLRQHPWGQGSNGHEMAPKGSTDIAPYSYSRAYMPIYDLTLLTKWNPDTAFLKYKDDIYKDLGNEYALRRDRIDTVQIGTLKDNKKDAKSIFEDNLGSYDWYDKYSDIPADKQNMVGAVRINYKTDQPMFGELEVFPSLVLKKDVMGSTTPNGDPNIMACRAYGKLSYDDSLQDLTKSAYFKQVSMFDDKGIQTQPQMPADGDYVCFGNLYVTGSRNYVAMTADSSSVNSDSVSNWTIRPTVSANVDETYHDDPNISVKLDKGLLYEGGSAYVVLPNGEHKKLEPSVKNDNGRETLTWNFNVDKNTPYIPEIHYSTKPDPFYLDFSSNGVTASVTNDVVINSENDISPESERSGHASMVVRKIETVGIAQSIDKNLSELNDEFSLTFKPYTTKDSENDVTGVWVMPENNDKLGSKFSGDLKLVDYAMGGRVKLYGNNKRVSETDPNKIDVSKDGWFELKSTGFENVKSIYYKIPKITSKRQECITLKLKATGNHAKDLYDSVVYGNSGSNYKVPVQSNMVRNTVRSRKISGIAWKDINMNGIFDDNEKVFSNVSLKLYRKDGSLVEKNLLGKDITNIKTDSKGHYEFDDLPSGDFYIMIDNPEYTSITKKNVGADLTKNSKFDVSSKRTDNIFLANVNDLPSDVYDFGNQNVGIYYQLGSITLYKKDDAGKPLSGATFRLFATEKDLKENHAVRRDVSGKVLFYGDKGYDDAKDYDCVSDKDGKVFFDKLPLYRENTNDYIVKEIKAPKGYSLADKAEHVKVDRDTQKGIFNFLNVKKMTLPVTGSVAILVIGLIVFGSAGGYWFVNKRK